MLKAGVCVSWNIPSAHTLECSPSIIRGVIFFPPSFIGKSCQLDALLVVPNNLFIPVHILNSSFLFCTTSSHCSNDDFFFLILHLCRPPSWQTCGITTSSGSHITFVSLWLLLSNLKMSVPAVSISHFKMAWVSSYMLFLQLWLPRGTVL